MRAKEPLPPPQCFIKAHSWSHLSRHMTLGLSNAAIRTLSFQTLWPPAVASAYERKATLLFPLNSHEMYPFLIPPYFAPLMPPETRPAPLPAGGGQGRAPAPWDPGAGSSYASLMEEARQLAAAKQAAAAAAAAGEERHRDKKQKKEKKERKEKKVRGQTCAHPICFRGGFLSCAQGRVFVLPSFPLQPSFACCPP